VIQNIIFLQRNNGHLRLFCTGWLCNEQGSKAPKQLKTIVVEKVFVAKMKKEEFASNSHGKYWDFNG